MDYERVLVLCVLSLLTSRVASSDMTCTPVKGKEFCQCKGDGFVINLNDILKFPVENIPDTSPQEAGQYTYQFSPCTPIACKDGGNANGVACQNGDPGTYIARNTKGANWTVQSLNPLKFQVLYGGGDQTFAPELIRVAQVQFDYFANTTSVAMIDNAADTQTGTRSYVFEVRGSTVRTERDNGVICLGVWGIVGLVVMTISLAGIASVVTGFVVYYCCSKRRQAGWNILQHPISKVSLSKEIKDLDAYENEEENNLPAFSIQ